MNSSARKTREILIVFCSVLVFSMLPGLIIKQTRMFQTSDPGFYFLHYGVICAVLFIFSQYTTLRSYLYIPVLLILLDLLMFQNPRHMFFIVALWACIFVYMEKFSKKGKFPGFLRCLLFALFVAFTHFLISLLAISTTYFPDDQYVIAGITGSGFLIGLGSGLGFKAGRKFDKMLK